MRRRQLPDMPTPILDPGYLLARIRELGLTNTEAAEDVLRIRRETLQAKLSGRRPIHYSEEYVLRDLCHRKRQRERNDSKTD